MTDYISTTHHLGIYTAADGGPWTSTELEVPEGTVRLINGALYASTRPAYSRLFNWPTFDKKGKPIPQAPKPVLIVWEPIKPKLRSRWGFA